MAQTNAEIKQTLESSKQLVDERKEQKRLSIESAKADREPAVRKAFRDALELLELQPAKVNEVEIDGITVQFIDPERVDSVLIPEVLRFDKMWYWFRFLLTRKTDGQTAVVEFEIGVDEKDRDVTEAQAHLHDAIQELLNAPLKEEGK